MTVQETRDEIRRMVRALLKEALPETLKDAPAANGPTLEAAIRAAANGGSVSVAIAGDADLDAFARAVASADAAPRDAIIQGRTRFRLAPGKTGTAPAERRAVALEKGVINEIKIAELAKEADRLLVGPRVVLTPLARDKAREIGLEIVRTRP